jgi:hypothetical protein
VRVARISEEEHNFIDAASMRNLIGSQPRKAHLRNELVNEDDHTNGTDEASKKRSTQNIVQEAEPEDASHQDECAGHGSDNAGNLGIPSSIIVPSGTLLDVFAHYLSNKKRAWSFRPYNHLRAGA